MAKEAIERTKQSLAEQIKKIQRPPVNTTQWALIDRYNSMVMGIQNYYSLATHINLDLDRVRLEVSRITETRLHPTREGKITQKALAKFSKSEQVRFLSGRPILPIGFVQCKKAMNKDVKANIFTEEGVTYLKQKENPHVAILQEFLLSMPIWNMSIEYNDNRQSPVTAQKGKDRITGEELHPLTLECHHIMPRSMGGDDSYQNLILINADTHELIHATKEETIKKYLYKLNLDKEQLKKLNKYRKHAGNKEIATDLLKGENS